MGIISERLERDEIGRMAAATFGNTVKAVVGVYGERDRCLRNCA